MNNQNLVVDNLIFIQVKSINNLTIINNLIVYRIYIDTETDRQQLTRKFNQHD